MEASEYDASQITRKGVDTLLQFLPYFSDQRTSFGDDASVTDGWVEPSIVDRKASDFCDACYEHGFVQDFDWGEWSQGRQRMITTGEGIERLDLAGIGQLLTAHLRGDRFSDGHLLEVMRSGQMARILRRLERLSRSLSP